MTTRFIFLLMLLSSCNCDEYYERDKEIIGRIKDYKEAYVLISKNYDYLKSKELNFESGLPGLEGLTINYENVTSLTDKSDNVVLSSLKGLWDRGVIAKSGEINFGLYNDSPSVDFYVKKCRKIEHIIYFGESDKYDHLGQTDDLSIFSRDSLEGHWRYVIQQVNSGQ